MKYAFVRVHAGQYPVKLMCRVFGLHRSAYYDWLNRGATVVSREEVELLRRMKALFTQSRESLGSRMLMKNLRL